MWTTPLGWLMLVAGRRPAHGRCVLDVARSARWRSEVNALNRAAARSRGDLPVAGPARRDGCAAGPLAGHVAWRSPSPRSRRCTCPHRALREQELQQPFGERVLDPLLRQFVRIGSRFTPADRMQRIRRRLDLAGNPPGLGRRPCPGAEGPGRTRRGSSSGRSSRRSWGVGPPHRRCTALVGGDAGLVRPDDVDLPEGSRPVRAASAANCRTRWTCSPSRSRPGSPSTPRWPRSLARREGPLSKEFSRVLQEMQIGTGRIDALRGSGRPHRRPRAEVFRRLDGPGRQPRHPGR